MRYLDRVYLVFDELKTVGPDEVAAAEARLGLRFPDGYAEYMTELGEGDLSGFLRVWTPGAVEKNTDELRPHLTDPFFWDEAGPLSPARLRESFLLADTVEGDLLVFHPDRPDELFFLPRHSEVVHPAGVDLDAAIDWLFSTGVLIPANPLLYFEPNGDRSIIRRSLELPFDVIRDALVGLALHDHVAFEERSSEDDEDGFEVRVKVGGKYVKIEGEDADTLLLVKQIGGDVSVSSSRTRQQARTTTVVITHVQGRGVEALRRYLDVLETLAGRSGKPQRRKP